MTEKIKKNWSFAETKALINIYSNRQEEYAKTVKKKKFWESILTDLEATDVLESVTTIEHTETKWRALWRAYKISKDRGSGGSSSRFPFLEIMDELFCSRPVISLSHAISVGVLSGQINPARTHSSSSNNLIIESDDESPDDPLQLVDETPPPKRKKRKSNHDKLQEVKMKYYEDKIKTTQQKRKDSLLRTKMLQEYISNKERSREERHQEILSAINK